MRNILTLLVLFSTLTLSLGACAPAAEEPVAEPVVEEAPPPPPPRHELTEVAISEEIPDFTSQNIEVLGIKIGDSTNAVAGDLGELTGDTVVREEDYITAYREGGILIYTIRLTGIARAIEVTSQLADEVVDPNLKVWLEDGDQSVLREWLGPEESLESIPDDNNATEFGYDSRGLRFIQRVINGQDFYAVRFSEMQ